MVKNKLVVGISLLAIVIVLICSGLFLKKDSKDSYHATLNPAVTRVQTTAAGIVKNVFVKPGDKVKRGQVLAEIEIPVKEDSAKIEIVKPDINGAKNRLKNAEDKYENAASMYKDGVISQEDYDDILAQLKTAQNAYKSAMQQLEKADAETKILSKTPLEIKKVYAPADGEISKTLLEKGAKTTSGQDMILLTLNAMKVTAYVDKDTTFKLERGQNVLIKVPEYKNRMYNGSIEYIGQKSVNNAEAKDKYPVFINFDSNINSSAFQASKNASVYFLNNKRSVF